MRDHTEPLRIEAEGMRLHGYGDTADAIEALLDERDALAARLDRIETETRHLREAVRVMDRRIKRGGPTNYLAKHCGYFTDEQRAAVSAALRSILEEGNPDA